MEWTTERVKALIRWVKVGLIVFTVLGMVFLIGYSIFQEAWQLVMTIVFLVIPAYFFFWGLRGIPEEERWAIQVFGKFYGIIGPGLVWICPLLMKPRRRVPIWSYPVEMFLEKPWIDFRVGGRARLIQPFLWLRVIGASALRTAESRLREAKDVQEKIQAEQERKIAEEEIRRNVYKMIYEIEDVDKAAREYTELRFRAILNNLLPDEALALVYEQKINWWEAIRRRFTKLPGIFAGWGVVGYEITVSDYEWSEEIATKRRAVYESERNVAIAEYKVKEAKFMAEVKNLAIGGVIGRILKTLKGQGYSDEEARELAPKVFNFFVATETGSLFLTSLGPGEEMGPIIAKIGAIIKATEEKYKKRGGKLE